MIVNEYTTIQGREPRAGADLHGARVYKFDSTGDFRRVSI